MGSGDLLYSIVTTFDHGTMNTQKRHVVGVETEQQLREKSLLLFQRTWLGGGALSLKNISQAREVAQWVKHLLHSRENLHLIHTKTDMVVHIFSRSAPVMRQEEAGESLEA